MHERGPGRRRRLRDRCERGEGGCGPPQRHPRCRYGSTGSWSCAGESRGARSTWKRIRSSRALAARQRKSISTTDSAAEWTCAPGGPAFFAYSTNYLVDVRYGVGRGGFWARARSWSCSLTGSTRRSRLARDGNGALSQVEPTGRLGQSAATFRRLLGQGARRARHAAACRRVPRDRQSRQHGRSLHSARGGRYDAAGPEDMAG